jgi:hypothetical protein
MPLREWLRYLLRGSQLLTRSCTQLSTLRHEKQRKREASKAKAHKEYLKKKAREEEKTMQRTRTELKAMYRKQGEEAKKRQRAAERGPRKKARGRDADD